MLPTTTILQNLIASLESGEANGPRWEHDLDHLSSRLGHYVDTLRYCQTLAFESSNGRAPKAVIALNAAEWLASNETKGIDQIQPADS